jgi:hypothetical protein
MGATGRRVYANIPANNKAMASSEVAMGRRMNGAEMFMRPPRIASIAKIGNCQNSKAISALAISAILAFLAIP